MSVSQLVFAACYNLVCVRGLIDVQIYDPETLVDNWADTFNIYGNGERVAWRETQAAKASEKWPGQINSRLSETSGAILKV